MPPSDPAAAPFCGLEWLPEGRVYEPKSAYRWSAARTRSTSALCSLRTGGWRAHGFHLDRTRVVLDLPFDVDLALLERGFGQQWERVARENFAREEASAARRAALPTAVTRPDAGGPEGASAAHEWSFRRLDEAHRFASSEWLTAAEHQFARDILSDAQSVVRRVEERLATPAGEEDLARAQDPAVRKKDVHAACRYLTGLDEDRARDANGRRVGTGYLARRAPARGGGGAHAPTGGAML